MDLRKPLCSGGAERTHGRDQDVAPCHKMNPLLLLLFFKMDESGRTKSVSLDMVAKMYSVGGDDNDDDELEK